MRVLITGICGFIGHHIAAHLLEHTDWDIIGIDRLDHAGTCHRLEEIYDKHLYSDRMEFIFHDLRAGINDYIYERMNACEINHVLHLAACTHVDRSIRNPVDCVMDNILGTVNVLEFLKDINVERFVYFSTDEVFGPAPPGIKYNEWDRYNSKNPYAASKAGAEELCLAYANTYGLPVIITHCHDSLTRCWTNNGFKNYKDLTKNDLVWTLNSKNELELNEIEEFIELDYKGDLINISSNKCDFNVTPEHRMLLKKRSEKSYYYKYAKNLLNLNTTEYIIPTTGNWNGLDDKYIVLENFKFLTEDFMEFLGWFISEGSATKTGTVSISNTNKKYQEEIINVIKRLGFSPKQYGINIQFCSIQFTNILRKLIGKYTLNKSIPKHFLNYNKYYLNILFTSLMKGDGSIKGNSYKRYYSSSIKLIENICELVIKLGYTASYSSRQTFSPDKLTYNKSYYVNISLPNIRINKSHISTNSYSGKVWCLRVKNGNFFTERNGNINVSGNCMNAFGERQNSEKFIPSTVKKILNGETITIHSDETLTVPGSRHWLYAKNIAHAIHFILTSHKITCDKYNIVGTKEVNNLELAQQIAKIMGEKLNYEMVDFHTSRPGHDLRYALSGGKLEKLGFKYPFDFENSLVNTVKWYTENQEWLV